jgi:uncharacterized protein (DUF1778 family)
MAVTEKISVAMGREELQLAKTAAKAEGVSLSAFVTTAVRERLEEKRRMEAAREVLETFAPEDFPSQEETRELLAFWSRQRDVAPTAKASSRRVREAGARVKRR